jgi:hypothetical protein
MAIEQQISLQLKFTEQLTYLIQALINFENAYKSIANLRATHVIATKASQKIANESILEKYPLTQYAESLWKHIEFVRVLVPTYEAEQIPLDIDDETYHRVCFTMLELSIAKSSDSCMYAKKMNDQDIKCKDILHRTYTDLQLTDRLNALGDLTNSMGSSRDKNESTLRNLIVFLGLADFSKEKNPDVDTVQFYFTHDIRISMNDVLCSFIRYVMLFYNIASTFELQLRSTNTSTDGSNPQSSLTLASNALRKLFMVDLLQEKFSALKNQLGKITIYEPLNLSSIKDETNAYIAMVDNSLNIALRSCEQWHKNIEERFPKLSSKDTDVNMSKMIVILINFKKQLLAFKQVFAVLNIQISEILKAAEGFKSAIIEDVTKKQAEIRADIKRSGSTTSPPRGITLFGRSSTPTPAAAITAPPRPPSTRPDTSPHLSGRSTSGTTTSSAESPQSFSSSSGKKSGSQIGRHSSSSGPLASSSSSPHLSNLPPTASPPPGGLKKQQ